MSLSLAELSQYFERKYCLYLQGERVGQATGRHHIPVLFIVTATGTSKIAHIYGRIKRKTNPRNK
jgi:hypothetical protein